MVKMSAQGQNRLPLWFSKQCDGMGVKEKGKREAKQTGEGQTDLLGNATNVFAHEDGRGARDEGKANMFSHRILSLCWHVRVAVKN